MSSWRTVRNAETDAIVLSRAKWCDTAWCRFRGLQLVRNLPEDEGLLFVTGSDSRTATSIHMFFMFLTIGVVWVNSQYEVVDKALAKPWRPAYAPQAPAQYFIEANPSILERVEVGDKLSFDEAVS